MSKGLLSKQDLKLFTINVNIRRRSCLQVLMRFTSIASHRIFLLIIKVIDPKTKIFLLLLQSNTTLTSLLNYSSCTFMMIIFKYSLFPCEFFWIHKILFVDLQQIYFWCLKALLIEKRSNLNYLKT